MRIFSRNWLLKCAALFAPVFLPATVNGAEALRNPDAVISALADSIYVVGETSGKVADMIAAEQKAAEEVRKYVAQGLTEGLLAKDKGSQSPLESAAYMGYPNVVAALLTSSLVRAHINDADDLGLSPWIAANISMKQSLWVCNPAVFSNPYKFVPMFVTQPYYVSNPTPPYKKTRELLEAAGASADVAKAKEFWIKNCVTESDAAKATVGASTDLQKTVQELALADFNAQLLKLQKQAADAQKKK
jgi:hypothetical protein